MRTRRIGIDAKAGPLLDDVRAELAYYQACGFDVVELSVHDLDVVLNGRLHVARFEAVVSLVREFDLEYTVHAPDRLNLAFCDDRELEKDVFAASLELCARVHAPLMVYHSGLSAFDWLRLQGPGAEWPSEEIMARAREAESEALQALMPLAARHGVTVAMENSNYSGFELPLLHRAGRPASALAQYFPSLFPLELAAQVAEVHHSNLGLTLDIAHLYTAARPCGLDYLATIKAVAPSVCHMHVDDNFGRPDGPYQGPRERNTHGEGDLHMPPGWGTIPFADVFAQLPDYAGVVLLEIKDRYKPYYTEARQLIEGYLREG